MVGVRNGSLARGEIASPGLVTIGTVPPGFTWLIKGVQLLNYAGVPLAGQVLLVAGDGSANVVLADIDLEPAAWMFWSGWAALDTGDQVKLQLGAAPVDYWVSGAELPGERLSTQA